MLSSQIPVKFALPFAAGASAPYTHQVPTASQISITPGAASMSDGFPPLCFQPVGSGGVPPFGEDFNGILNQISAWSQWQAAGGPVKWDSAFSSSVGGYPQGAIVASTATIGLQWLSLVDNNTSNPDSGGANWVSIGQGASRIVSDTSSQSVTLGYNSSVRIASGTVPYFFPLSSTLFNGFEFYVYIVSGTITFSPNVSDNIQGYSAGSAYTASINSWVRIKTNAAGLWIITPTSWSNGRISITTATTLGPQHNNATIDLTSGTFFGITFPAGNTLQPDFKCTIVNNESISTPIAKGVSGVGGAAWKLYPGQSFQIYNDNNTLQVLGFNVPASGGSTPSRFRMVSTQFYVDNTLGSNNPMVADGLGPGARAYNTLDQLFQDCEQNFDFLGSSIFATVAASTTPYNSSIIVPRMSSCHVLFLNGASPVVFNGNGYFSSGVLWQPYSSAVAVCAEIGDGSLLEISNIFLNGNVSVIGSVQGIQIHQDGIIDVNGGCGFGSFGPSGYPFATNGCGGTININASYQIAGDGSAVNGAAHFYCGSMAQVNLSSSIVVTLGTSSNAINFNGGAWFQCGPGFISLGTGITFANSGSISGTQKWNVGAGGTLFLSGNASRIPGGTAGNPTVGSAPTGSTGWATA